MFGVSWCYFKAMFCEPVKSFPLVYSARRLHWLTNCGSADKILCKTPPEFNEVFFNNWSLNKLMGREQQFLVLHVNNDSMYLGGDCSRS